MIFSALTSNAHIARESTVIHVSAMMCGIELYVPSTWNISVACVQLLGGIQESGRPGIKGEDQVRIDGKVSLSGIKIIYI